MALTPLQQFGVRRREGTPGVSWGSFAVNLRVLPGDIGVSAGTHRVRRREGRGGRTMHL